MIWNTELRARAGEDLKLISQSRARYIHRNHWELSRPAVIVTATPKGRQRLLNDCRARDVYNSTYSMNTNRRPLVLMNRS
jgi:hypothetical protein